MLIFLFVCVINTKYSFPSKDISDHQQGEHNNCYNVVLLSSQLYDEAVDCCGLQVAIGQTCIMISCNLRQKEMPRHYKHCNHLYKHCNKL